MRETNGESRNLPGPILWEETKRLIYFGVWLVKELSIVNSAEIYKNRNDEFSCNWQESKNHKVETPED